MRFVQQPGADIAGTGIKFTGILGEPDGAVEMAEGFGPEPSHSFIRSIIRSGFRPESALARLGADQSFMGHAR